MNAEEVLSQYASGKRDFKGVNLSQSVFRQVELSEIQLNEADLTQADLLLSNLSRSQLSQANLSQAILQGVDLHQANLRRANLTGTNLQGADLNQSILVEANLSHANLSCAHVTAADLYRANLSKSILSGSTLSQSNFIEANLRNANLSASDLSRSQLMNTQLCDADLSLAKLSEANLTGANLTGANLAEADLTGANLSGANLTNVNLTGARLEAAIMPDGKRYGQLEPDIPEPEAQVVEVDIVQDHAPADEPKAIIPSPIQPPILSSQTIRIQSPPDKPALDNVVPIRKQAEDGSVTPPWDNRTIVDDRSLIQSFVQGKGKLLSNNSLRIKTIFDATQLLSQEGELLASLKAGEIARVLVRKGTHYSQLLHQMLLQNGFAPSGEPEQSGFIPYRRYPILAGYTLNYTQAKQLWRAWWVREKHSAAHAIQMDLLLFIQNQWSPIQDIRVQQDSLIVKVGSQEVTLKGTAWIAWLGHPLLQDLMKRVLSVGESIAPGSNSDSGRRLPPIPTNQPGYSLAETPEPEIELGSRATPEPVKGNPPLTATSVGTPSTSLSPLSARILHFAQGKLHVKTQMGEIIVEGNNLNFWLK